MEKQSGVKIVPSEELGNVLPIGVFQEGKFVKDFSFRELSPDMEREVGKYRRERGKGLPNTIVVSKVVACMLETLGGKPFGIKADGKSEMTDEEKLTFVKSLYVADVYYMYLRARMAELGDEYVSMYQCSQCNYTMRKMTVDLKTMDVCIVVDPTILSVPPIVLYTFVSS